VVSKRVINYNKLKWTVFSFQPYKSPGIDGIMSIMLQQGFELLAGKFLMLLRASLALGYNPMSWRHIRMVFIPKPGKLMSQAKSLQCISLMSVILKTLEKLLDTHIRSDVLVEKPLYQNQFAYRARMSAETALFQVIHRLEKSLNHKEIVLRAFIDVEGTFENTSFHAIITAARERGIEETCCRWISSMLESRLVHTSLTGSSLTAKVVGGCPQRGVLSPLLWNLVDRLLTATNDLGFCTYGYADDIVIIVHGKFAHTVRKIMQEALKVVVKWVANEGLNISPHKTAIVPFTNRRKTRGLRTSSTS
jgi:retron-type reverse transcriptase